MSHKRLKSRFSGVQPVYQVAVPLQDSTLVPVTAKIRVQLFDSAQNFCLQSGFKPFHLWQVF